MRDNFKFRLKYFTFIAFFGMCINLIYLIVPIYMMVIYDRVLYSFSTATLITLSLLTIFSLVVMGILEYVRSKLLLKAGLDMEQRMVPHVLTSMFESASALDKPSYSQGMPDLILFREGIASYGILRILDIPWVVVYLVILYFINPLIGLVATAGVGMVFLFQLLLRFLNKKRYTVSHAGATAGSIFLSSTVRNAELITGMGMLVDVREKYTKADQQTQIDRYEAESNRCTVGAVKAVLQGLFTAGIFCAGTYLFFNHEITVGSIFASVIIIIRLFIPLDMGFETLKSSIESLAAYKRLLHFIEVTDTVSTLTFPRPEGRLTAENITLMNQNKTLLRNISFLVNPGEILGVFGPAAGGKTALVRTILGIWTPVAGKIRLDGGELNQWNRQTLGKYLGYFPQETELFMGSVAENISRLGPVESEKVILAAKRAHCHEMILALPGGYDFMIDSTGKNLSSGQRQRIGLARTLYGDPQVLVMDVPHSNLDEPGFRALLNTLQLLKNEKKSVVIVTEKPNILAGADKLLMLKEGQVAMYGPAKEVLSKLTNPGQKPQNQPRQQVQATPAPVHNKQNESGDK